MRYRRKGTRRVARAQPATAPRLRKRKAPASGGRRRRARRGGTAEVEAAVVGEDRARGGVGRSGIFSTSAFDFVFVGRTALGYREFATLPVFRLSRYRMRYAVATQAAAPSPRHRQRGMLTAASKIRSKSGLATTTTTRAMPFLLSSFPAPTTAAPSVPPSCPPTAQNPSPHLRLPPPPRRALIAFFAAAAPLGALSPSPRRAMASLATSAAAAAAAEVTHLSQRDAAEIDEQLMGPLGFSVDQLMELAGLSVAAAVAEVYKLSEYTRVLIICGPGNNGGDGLVAARHLYHFGYKPFVCYPKRTAKPLYSGLVTQLESLDIPFVPVEDLFHDLPGQFDIVIDAMFGFSFHGTPRPPFDDLVQMLVSLSAADDSAKRLPIVSVDIPSGWHVEEGDVNGGGIKPDMLVSLTAPKLCAKKFTGPHHFLGGRFVPPPISSKYGLELPPYPGTSMCVRIGKAPSVDISSLRENYISPELLENQVMPDPFDQFRRWFDEAVTASLREPNAMALTTVNKAGKPSSRMVLLKGVDKHGFVWYTNYGSQKAHDLSENSNAALLFYWNEMNRQVRVEGLVQKVSEEESEKYFHSRPRGSQLGAIVSKQSTVISGRDVLQQAYKELEQKYSDGSFIPKPDYWGGYRLTPNLFEFWQGQQSRLHDRLQYSQREVGGSTVWHIERLSP